VCCVDCGVWIDPDCAVWDGKSVRVKCGAWSSRVWSVECRVDWSEDWSEDVVCAVCGMGAQSPVVGNLGELHFLQF
jgi:hypothetical protein